MNRPAVVIVGNLSDGFTVYGPYESFDDATEGCAEFQDAETWVTGLYAPDPEVSAMPMV